MDPKGHAAIVTGAASGLGAETAAALAQAGAKVACLDVNIEGARATASKIGGLAIQCDVTSADGAATALKEAAAKQGPARILVNCAGVGPAKRIVGKDGPQPLADFERVIAINLVGTFNMMRLFAASTQNLEPFTDGVRLLQHQRPIMSPPSPLCSARRMSWRTTPWRIIRSSRAASCPARGGCRCRTTIWRRWTRWWAGYATGTATR